MLSTYNARTVSSNAKLYALFEATGHIKYYVIALQETKSRKADIRQHNDGALVIRGEKTPSRNVGGVGFIVHPYDETLVIRGEKTPSRNVGGVGFIVHPSVFHIVDSPEIPSPRLAILLRHPPLQKTISIITRYSQHAAAEESKLGVVYGQIEEVIRLQRRNRKEQSRRSQDRKIWDRR
ncbi:unnamed protein product [Nippostrongylus brasiliensis]|uniref:Endonuclease/exonuclease/phosphatase n=1 Tax=Nippostrongylus brasiliensis TaxID=27835 RepID=A0A0N4YIG3_NIPBR|nr:unnamed protein product [Nippostrongylus brasiliensis]